MRAIDADKLCEDLLTRWSIADKKQEQAVREIMAKVVTPIVVSQPTITADRPKGEVNAVKVYERELHNLERGYITLGEFDKRIEPLQHLYYDRPEGEWIIERKNQGGYTSGGNAVKSCSNCGWIYGASRIIPHYKFCPMCGAKMKGADDEESV